MNRFPAVWVFEILMDESRGSGLRFLLDLISVFPRDGSLKCFWWATAVFDFSLFLSTRAQFEEHSGNTLSRHAGAHLPHLLEFFSNMNRWISILIYTINNNIDIKTGNIESVINTTITVTGTTAETIDNSTYVKTGDIINWFHALSAIIGVTSMASRGLNPLVPVLSKW